MVVYVLRPLLLVGVRGPGVACASKRRAVGVPTLAVGVVGRLAAMVSVVLLVALLAPLLPLAVVVDRTQLALGFL